MFCIRCGAALPAGAAFCPACGAAVVAAPAAIAAGAPAAAPVAWRFGGFWRRLASYLLDRLLLGILFAPLGFFVLLPLFAGSADGWPDPESPAEAIGAILGAALLVGFLATVATWLYFALLQSSSRQASLGQMALDLRVTDLAGRRISFARASGRYFATFVTGLTFGLGYLVMLFTTKKQTLHDLIAGTLVVR